jgi:D-serine deaminase-like pyridoxal phosphate-dependent protein
MSAPPLPVDRYHIEDTSRIITPALVVFQEIVERNLAAMVRIAGSPERLRPHCKTHKMAEVIRLELQLGITRHKCATFAEAEMLAEAGAEDILLAYNLVGANLHRAADFQEKFPAVAFSVTADHPRPVAQLGALMSERGMSLDVLLDVDTGQHRTGVPPDENARKLYRQLADTPGLRPGGLHVYDGQNHQVDLQERTEAVMQVWRAAAALRDALEASGLPVPRIVAGGTGSFPIFARIDDPALQLSPGTCVFHDAGYSRIFPDLDFTPAALLLTRVISRPTAQRVTLDLGYKACASDPPAGQRLVFPQLPDAREVLQNEEHLVLETSEANRLEPGDELFAIPRHICPTSALHKQAYVVRDGKLSGAWSVAARDRWLTV